MSFWSGKRVLVTGGAGFLGSHVVEELKRRGCETVLAPRSREYDLREKNQVRQCLADCKPDTVIHLAAVVGGIGANRLHPGSFFYDNAMMGIQMVEEGRKAEREGVVCDHDADGNGEYHHDGQNDDKNGGVKR